MTSQTCCDAYNDHTQCCCYCSIRPSVVTFIWCLGSSMDGEGNTFGKLGILRDPTGLQLAVYNECLLYSHIGACKAELLTPNQARFTYCQVIHLSSQHMYLTEWVQLKHSFGLSSFSAAAAAHASTSNRSNNSRVMSLPSHNCRKWFPRWNIEL